MSTQTLETPRIPASTEAKEQRLCELLEQWHHAEKQVTDWTLKERMLRQEIFDLAFPNPQRGTNKRSLPYNMALLGQYSINVTLDPGALDASRSLIPQPIFDRVVQYKPVIVQGEYFKLSPPDLALFAACVTEKPGLPTLQLKPLDQVRGLK